MKQLIEQRKDNRANKRVELLAPAGSYDCMRAAINAGADAVYMGGSRFGARAYAENPEQDALLRAIDWVHVRGKKLYLTINTLFKEAELEEELEAFLLPLYHQGLDAVIVQDVGVVSFVKKYFPDSAVRSSMRKELGIEDCFVVGHVGRFTHQKNHSFLLEVFSEIKKLNSNAKLLPGPFFFS